MAIDLVKKPKKVILSKSGDTHKVSLDKKSDKNITINLNWNQGKKGFLFGFLGGNSGIDLDLGCFYELNIDGKRYAGAIDGLQFANGNGGRKDEFSAQGCYTGFPFIWHCGDDRSGASSDGESILVNPIGMDFVKRIIVYCFIYDGAAKWSQTDAVASIKVPNAGEVVVKMGEQSDRRTFCALAEIKFNQGSMSVKKLVTFHNSHSDCDEYYGIGLSYQASGGK